MIAKMGKSSHVPSRRSRTPFARLPSELDEDLVAQLQCRNYDIDGLRPNARAGGLVLIPSSK
jgi:hypothetical protein